MRTARCPGDLQLLEKQVEELERKGFVKGQVLCRVAPNAVGGGPHSHWGLNVELLLGAGKQLKYGANGNGPDYTYGSPTVGQQLKDAL